MEVLFGPAGTRELLESHWPERHFAVHGPAERLPPVLRGPLLRSLDALAQVYRAPVAFGRGALDTRTFSSDAHAGQLFKLGFSVYLSDIAAILPGGAAWLAALEQALGVSTGCSKIGAFASPRGDGLPCHFDAEDVISVQLSGAKIFEVAPVADLPYPVGRQFGPGMLPGEELFAQAGRGFPTPEGSNFERIRLEPGSVLFLPRGTWHRTLAESDSFSVSVGIRSPPVLDYFLRQLRYLLLQDPQWRRPLYGAAYDDDRRGASTARLAELLKKLPSQVAKLAVTDLVPPARGDAPAPITPTTRLQKVPMSSLEMEPAGALLRLTVRSWDQDWVERTTLRTDVPGHLRDVLEWLSVAQAAFSAGQLRQQFASVPLTDLAQLLDLLAKAGFLRRLWFPFLGS